MTHSDTRKLFFNVTALNPILHELFHDFSVKVHVTGRLIYAVEG